MHTFFQKLATSQRHFSTGTNSVSTKQLGSVATGIGLGVAGMLGFHISKAKAAESEKGHEPLDNYFGEVDSPSVKKTAGGIVSEVLQSYAPIRSIGCHKDDIMFVSGEPDRQFEFHELCTFLNDDVAQCLLYDSDKRNARLVGVKYTIGERIFKNLSAEEQKLWGSNQYEVKGGISVAPRLPQIAENELMNDCVNTYSKTYLTWQIDNDYLPLRIPQLMYTITQEGPEVDRNLLSKRAKKLNADQSKLQKARATIEAHPPLPNADYWKSGTALQLAVQSKKMPAS
jgi:hypothetical protein